MTKTDLQILTGRVHILEQVVQELMYCVSETATPNQSDWLYEIKEAAQRATAELHRDDQ